MHSAAQTNRINVKEDPASSLCDRGAQGKDSNGSSSKLRTRLAPKKSKSPIITIRLENCAKDVSRTPCSNSCNTVATQENILSTTATFPVSVTGSHPTPAVDSATPRTAIPPLRMPIPTYCIPNFQSAPSRYGHSVFSPYRQRVVIRPLHGDPNCMFRYVTAFNSFPMSMSNTGTTDSTSNSSATFDGITQQTGYGKSDKAVQTVENRLEEYNKLECDIARQRKLISQLMKIIVKDKLEREKLDEAKSNLKRTFADTAEPLTNNVLSSSSREYLASLMKHAPSEVASATDLHNSERSAESSHEEVFVSRDDPSVQYRGSASPSLSGQSNAETKEIATGKSSHRLMTKETSKKKNENEDIKECDSNDELIERGRRALELLSSGSYTLNQPQMQPYLSLESFETKNRKSADCKNDNVVNVPQKDATTQEYFLIEENRASNDVIDKSSQEIGKTKIDGPFVVADSNDHAVTATAPFINGVSNTEPNSDDVAASNKSKKNGVSALSKERSSKKRRLSSRKKLSSEEESNNDEKMGNRRSPRKRMKPSDSNEYIRRSASKQATKKIYDILKGSDSDPSPPSKSTDCSNQVNKKTRRKLLPPKIARIDDIIDANCSENCCEDSVIIKVEPADEVHDAVSHCHAEVTKMPLYSPNNSYLPATEDISNQLEQFTPKVPSNSKLPHNPNDPKQIVSNTLETQPFFILPELRVKIEKLDDQTSLLLCNAEQEQTEALDLRIAKSSKNTTMSKASDCRFEHPLPPNGSEPVFHIPFGPHFPPSSTHLRRTGGFVPSLIGESLSNMDPVGSDIVFSPFVSTCQKQPNQDEPTSGQNLGMWLRKRAPRAASQGNIGRKSKSAPSARKSSKQVNKVKTKYRKKPRALAPSGTGNKKSGRKKRKQTVKDRVCLPATELQNSEGNDDSSDYALLEEKTKKLKKRREYRNSNLRKATKSSSKLSEFLSVNELPFVTLSNNTSESSEIDTIDKRSTPYQSKNKPITTTGFKISESDNASPTQHADAGVVSHSSMSDRNVDESVFEDLPIPAKTISELELAIEKMKEQIERVSREREDRLLSELSSSEYERPNDLLSSKLFNGIPYEAADAEKPLKDVVKVEKDDRDILTSMPFESGALTELVDAEKDSQRQSKKFSPEESNKRGNINAKTDEGAAAREASDVAEWTMTPRKACKEVKHKRAETQPKGGEIFRFEEIRVSNSSLAYNSGSTLLFSGTTEKITRLAHQPTKQGKCSRTKSEYS